MLLILDSKMSSQSKYHLLPLAELTRELGQPYDTLWRLVKAGAITPDQIAGKQLLFRSDRIAELLPALKANMTPARFLRIRPLIKRAHRRLNAA